MLGGAGRAALTYNQLVHVGNHPFPVVSSSVISWRLGRTGTLLESTAQSYQPPYPLRSRLLILLMFGRDRYHPGAACLKVPVPLSCSRLLIILMLGEVQHPLADYSKMLVTPHVVVSFSSCYLGSTGTLLEPPARRYRSPLT